MLSCLIFLVPLENKALTAAGQYVLIRMLKHFQHSIFRGKVLQSTLTATQLQQVLLLIEEAHNAPNAQALRQCVVYGVGAMVESSSCAWTELKSDLFTTTTATATVVDISDKDVDVNESIQLFNRYASQHPVIARAVHSGNANAQSISDFLTRSEFQNLELYQYLYKHLHTEDQLSVGFVENGYVTGLSVNRATWGFTENERSLLNHVARCVFPFYRILQKDNHSETENRPMVETYMGIITEQYQVLGITPREGDVLALIARGKSNKQIALAFNISEGTVKKHVENLFRRMEVNNRVSLTIKAMTMIQIGRHL
ncbi:MAG: DNA-binding CsgD family transcriptional regulator [Reinekea sp.]